MSKHRGEQSNDELELVLDAARHELGGVAIRRALPRSRKRMLGPFVLIDHMGPQQLRPGSGVDVPPHPHIGLATVTWLFEGQLVHRDNLGFEQAIEPGAVNWMNAGRGIVHSERTGEVRRSSGGTMHGIQAWVALPVHSERGEPSFHHYPAAGVPHISGPGYQGKLIAGSAWGYQSPAMVDSPLFYAELNLREGTELAPPVEHRERGVYLVSGEAAVAGQTLQAGQLAVWRPGSQAVLAASRDCRVMLFGGEPLGHRYIWWNFVSSRRETIEQAADDWRHDRFDPVPGEHERIPLPETRFKIKDP